MVVQEKMQPVRLGKQVIRSHSGRVAELQDHPVNAEIDYQRP